MAERPLISEPELLRRLSMGDAEFRAYVRELLEELPARAYETAVLDQALAYPWERPEGSYLLVDGDSQPLGTMPESRRRQTLEELLAPAAGRVAALAIGSNRAPAVLARKLAHFDEEEDRTVLALTGRLHGFDVGVAAQPALYGSLPATLFPSPGTAVATTLLSLTPAQLTQLAWTELSYRLGRLRARFEADEEPVARDEALAFVSRFGAFCVDGGPVALGAVPASGRRARALSQEEALDAAAALALGPEARAEMLVRAVHEDPAALAERLAETLHVAAERFESDDWTPLVP